MAKKKRKDKEEQEYEFKPPEFDEREFLLKELRDTKTVLLTVGYAGLFGILAGVITGVDDRLAPIGFALVLAGLVSLKYIYPLLKIDVSEFQKKNWAGNIAWFFFTFLAVWVLSFNYPFADHADPSVTDLTVWVDNGTTVTAIDYKYVDSLGREVWVVRSGESLESVLGWSSSYTYNMTAKISDNGKLSTVRISVNGGAFTDMTPEADHRFGEAVNGGDISSRSIVFEIRATDEVGHETVKTVSALTASA